MVISAFAAQEWSAAGHAAPPIWPQALAWGALGLCLLGFLALLVRAFLRRRWYRAQGVLGADDLRALHDELVAAEQKTVGEILPVVLERSDRHPGAAWLAALCFLLFAGALFALWRPLDSPALLFVAQLACGALGFALAHLLPDFQRFFVSEGRASEMAEEQAAQEFHRHGLHHTAARTGVLLFVSLFERRAIVLADEGIHARVGAEHWKQTNEAVLAGIRGGSLRSGLSAGIRGAGAVLAEHFPHADGDRNEVPDRVIVRAE